jgi:pSer/pThr/pTyr-binding forkhead associated (FHA) protein
VLLRVYPDGSVGERYRLDHPGVIAGRKGEIALSDDPQIADEHVRFTQIGAEVYIEDMGSACGIYLQVRAPQRLKDGDVIRMGRQQLRFATNVSAATAVVSADRTAVFTTSPPSSSTPSLLLIDSHDKEIGRYELRGGETSLGRSKGTYTFPDDPYLSTTHARIRLQENRYVLEDAGSTNGTFMRVRKRALAREGDTLLIGKQLLRVLAERS